MGFTPQVSGDGAARVTGASGSWPSRSPDLHTWAGPREPSALIPDRAGLGTPHLTQSEEAARACARCLHFLRPRGHREGCPPGPAAIRSSVRVLTLPLTSCAVLGGGYDISEPGYKHIGLLNLCEVEQSSRAVRQHLHPSPCVHVHAMQLGLKWRGVCLGKVLDLAGSPSLSSPSLGHLPSKGLEGGPAVTLRSATPWGASGPGVCMGPAGPHLPRARAGSRGAAGSGAAFPGARKEAGWA